MNQRDLTLNSNFEGRIDSNDMNLHGVKETMFRDNKFVTTKLRLHFQNCLSQVLRIFTHQVINASFGRPNFNPSFMILN